MNASLLALEWSSSRLSVAWRGAEGLTMSRLVELERFRAPAALSLLESLLKETGPQANPPVEIRIGRGPGNYSGIRQAFAWAAGYAAPGGLRLRACASARAQALRLIREGVRGPFLLLGDARRGSWWGAEFPNLQPDWRLAPPAEWLKLKLPVYSAEAGRLRKAAAAVTSDFPRAEDLLDLPDDFPFEENLPLYLHPPVG